MKIIPHVQHGAGGTYVPALSYAYAVDEDREFRVSSPETNTNLFDISYKGGPTHGLSKDVYAQRPALTQLEIIIRIMIQY